MNSYEAREKRNENPAYRLIREIILQEYRDKEVDLVASAFFELIQSHNGNSVPYKRQVLKALATFSNLTEYSDKRINRTLERVRLRLEEIVEAQRFEKVQPV